MAKQYLRKNIRDIPNKHTGEINEFFTKQVNYETIPVSYDSKYVPREERAEIPSNIKVCDIRGNISYGPNRNR